MLFFLEKLCHVQCNNLSLDYSAFNLLSFIEYFSWKYQNHLYINFYCLAFLLPVASALLHDHFYLPASTKNLVAPEELLKAEKSR